MLQLSVLSHREDFTLDLSETLNGRGISAVFGPSGSGKTTLLRCIAGLTPCAGTIQLDDDIWLDSASGINLPAHQRPIGYVFQDARLFSHLDVRGNLVFAQKRARADIQCNYEDVIEMLDLAPLLSRSVHNLSGGEQQRVALARTLLNQPRLLLLDEPLSALDQARKAELLPYINSVCREFEMPGIFVSHALDEVVQLADEIVLLEQGRSLASGPTKEMLTLPELARLTPRFDAGAMLQATVSSYDQKYQLAHLSSAGQTLVVPIQEAPTLGDQVRLFIHARDISLATQRPTHTSVRNVLHAVVANIQSDDLTPFAEVRIRLGDEELSARITRAAVADLQLNEGDPVFALIKSVSFDPGR